MIRGSKIYRFWEQVKQEASRVVWLSRKELIISTAMVIVTVFIISLICLFLDYGIHNVIQFLLNIGK